MRRRQQERAAQMAAAASNWNVRVALGFTLADGLAGGVWGYNVRIAFPLLLKPRRARPALGDAVFCFERNGCGGENKKRRARPARAPGAPRAARPGRATMPPRRASPARSIRARSD